jgi:hypothetical protein
MEQSEKLRGDRPKFMSVVARKKEDFNRHPKQPPPCILEDLKSEKYYE